MPQAVSGVRQTEWLSPLLVIGAALETPVGLALLAVPSPLASLLLGAPLAGSGLVVARLAGGGLLALGIACWFARSTPIDRAGWGVAVGLLGYNIVAFVTLAVVATGPAGSALSMSAALLHGLMTLGLSGALIVHGRQDARLDR